MMIRTGREKYLTRTVAIACLVAVAFAISGIYTPKAEAAFLGPAPDNPYKQVAVPSGTIVLYTDINLGAYQEKQVEWNRATVNNASVSYSYLGYVGSPYFTNVYQVVIPYTNAQFSSDHDITLAYRVTNGTWHTVTAQDFIGGGVVAINNPTCATSIFAGKPSGACSFDISTRLTLTQRSGASLLYKLATGTTCTGTTISAENLVATNNDTHITSDLNVTIQPTTEQCSIKIYPQIYYPNLMGTGSFAHSFASNISGSIPVYVSTITDTGCPGVIKEGQNFTCNPTMVKNLLPEHEAGAIYTWSTDSGTLTQSATNIPNPTLNITGATQSPKLTLSVYYPAADYTRTAQSAAIPLVSANIAALNCPVALFSGEDFSCNPTITTTLTSEYRAGAIYTWSTDSGTLTQSATNIPNPTLNITGATQSPKLTLSVHYPAADLTISSTMTDAVPMRTLSITSAGCPASALTAKNFTCTPVLATNIPAEEQNSIVYTWSGDGLMVNEDQTLSFSGTGNRTLTITATYPGMTDRTVTATINIIEPEITLTSLTCPEKVIEGEQFTCSDVFNTNLPEEYKTGATKTWAAEGLTINQDGSMKFTTEGAKTATFTLIYPLVNYQSSHEKTITVIKPTLAITALNCPAEMLANEQFACTPEFTTNLPDNYKTGIVKAWTGDGLVVAGDKMSFATPGAKTLTYTLTYPGADPATATASIAIGGSSIAITSLGCPAELKTQESFRCTPVIETDMTQTYQDKLTYTWTGSNMETADDGFMAMTASGNKGLTLVVALPEKNISVKKSEYINVILSDTNIKSVGCPSTAYYGDPFTCAPDVETVGDPNALEFVWSGTALGNDSNGKLLFASSGTDNKSVNKITLTVTNPETGFTMQRTQKVNVSPISVVVSALGCSSRIKSQQPFKCTPAVKVNALKIKEGLQYAWSGDDMTVRENGTFVFKTEGTKTINLRITHPAYPQIQISEDYTVEVTKPILTVNGLGCPRYISEYINANCFPQISNDDTLGNVVYDWKLNGESVGTQKIGRMIFKAPGTSTVSLTARLVDPDTGETIVSSTLPEEKTVSPNKNPLRLYVRGPSLAEQGTEITLEAKTTFQVDEIVDYTWNIGGTEYKGAIITVPVPATQAEPIAYTVTAKPNCCEMIAAETRTGAVRVGEYRFPTIMFSGPRSSETNIAPFDALFKTGVITTSNLTYTWDFGDGSPLEVTDKTATRKTHTYATPGTYTAKLSVKDKNDEVREYTTEVVVVPLPTRNLAIESTMLNPYSRRPVMGYFKYGITDGVRQDYPLSNTWSVNDVVVSDRPSALINFNETGTHMVKLEVKTKYGNLLNTTKAVDVVENQHPQCTIMQSLFAVGKYLLTANCTDSDGKVVRYKWDLGGGITSSSQKAYLTVKQEGSYPVSLTATDDSGDSVTVNGVISVTDINAAPTGE